MLLTFGKYKNKSVDDIFKLDKQYILWLIKQSWFEEQHINLYRYSKNVIDNFNPVINNDKFIVYTDGACPNNGSSKARSSIGIHFSEKNLTKINDVSQQLNMDHHSNNYAEMYAIYECLSLIKKNVFKLSNYNTISLPSEILINKKNYSVIRKKENISEIIEKDAIPDWL